MAAKAKLLLGVSRPSGKRLKIRNVSIRIERGKFNLRGRE